MQYVLDEAEMEAVRQLRRDAEKAPHPEALANVCKHVASTMIMTVDVNGWGADRGRPYGCIHVNRQQSYGYCDKCPVLGICPLPKDFSK